MKSVKEQVYYLQWDNSGTKIHDYVDYEVWHQVDEHVCDTLRPIIEDQLYQVIWDELWDEVC